MNDNNIQLNGKDVCPFAGDATELGENIIAELRRLNQNFEHSYAQILDRATSSGSMAWIPLKTHILTVLSIVAIFGLAHVVKMLLGV
jgi:hypothetical protein